MSYAQSFWPQREGDKACPQCGCELFMTASLWTGGNPMIRLRCYECGSEYIIDGGLCRSMNLELRKSPSRRI